VPNIKKALKLAGMHLMELLGDVGQVKSCFSLFAYSVRCKIVGRFTLNVPHAQKSI
jgi:hypothetical protein